MNAHSAYFQQQFDASKLLLYGPVMASDGAFGLGILEVADEAEARQFGEHDPSVRAGLNRWDLYPMQVARSRARVESHAARREVTRMRVGREPKRLVAGRVPAAEVTKQSTSR